MNMPARIGTVTVLVCLDPVRDLWAEPLHVPPGQSLAELCDGLQLPHEGLRSVLSAWVGEWPIPREKWPVVRPRAGTRVVFAIEIGGPLIGLIFAGISAVAKSATALLAGKLTLGGFLKAGIGKIIGGLLSIGLSLLLQGLKPTPESEEAPKPLGMAGAQNDFEPGSYFKLWMGKFKDSLQVTVPAFTEIDGDDQLVTIGLTAVGLFTEPILYAGDVELTTVQDREVVIWEASAGETPPAEVTVMVPDTKIERVYDLQLSEWETDTNDDNDDAVEIDGTPVEAEPLWHGAQALKNAEIIRFEYTFDALAHLTTTDINPAFLVLRHRMARRDDNSATWGDWVLLPQLLIRAKEPNRQLRIQFYIHFVTAYPPAYDPEEVLTEPFPPRVGNPWPGTATGTPFSEVAGWGDLFNQTHASLPPEGLWVSELLTPSGDGFGEWWWESEQKVHLYLRKFRFPLGGYKFEIKRSWVYTWGGYDAVNHAATTGEAGVPSPQYDFFSAYEASPDVWKIIHNPRNYRNTVTLTTLQMMWPEFPIQPRGNPKTHIFVRVRNQEIGTIKAEWTRLIPNWNGAEWVANQPTSNPASLYRDVLMGMHNARPVPAGLIDGSSLVAMHMWCDESAKECRGILPGAGSVEDALKAVALTAHGRPVQAPIHRVILDRIRPGGAVGLITSRSAAGFSFEKLFKEKPHALDASFFSANDDYENRSVRVYAQGYNADGSGGLIAATRFQSITYPLIVSEAEIIPRAELDLAWIWFRDRPIYCTQALLAREHEVGDLVLVETEILGRVSGRGRIKSWSGTGGSGNNLRNIADLRLEHDLRVGGAASPTISSIVIDETPFFGTGATFDLRGVADLRTVPDLRSPSGWGVAIRQRNGDVVVLEVSSFDTETKEIFFAVPTALDIAIGDEVATGALGLETRKMLVWNMAPRGRMQTEIMLIDYAANNIYLEGGVPAGSELVTHAEESVMYHGHYLWWTV